MGIGDKAARRSAAARKGATASANLTVADIAGTFSIVFGGSYFAAQ